MNSRRSYDSVDILSGCFLFTSLILTWCKSVGVINISWFYVTMPLWLPTVLLSCVLGYFAVLTRLEEFAKRDLKKK